MRSFRLILWPVALLATWACTPRAPKTPDWVASAPGGTVLAISGQASWIIQNREFQTAISRFPYVEQTLDLFLKKARISPAQETGRVTFYLLEMPRIPVQAKENPPVRDASKSGEKAVDLQAQFQSFLIQLGGFKEPQALASAVADSFPEEGKLRLGDREYPLHVVLDVNKIHIRTLIDAKGRIWIGDSEALDTLASRGFLPSRHMICLASEWIDGKAPAQGFLQPQPFMKELAGKLPSQMASELPVGVEGLAWSITPGSGPRPLHQMELVLSGSREGINQVTPWLQRLVGAVTALQSAPSQPPEILKEPNRVGLRARFTPEQIASVMSKLNQPIPFFGTTRTPASP